MQFFINRLKSADVLISGCISLFFFSLLLMSNKGLTVFAGVGILFLSFVLVDAGRRLSGLLFPDIELGTGFCLTLSSTLISILTQGFHFLFHLEIVPAMLVAVLAIYVCSFYFSRCPPKNSDARENLVSAAMIMLFIIVLCFRSSQAGSVLRETSVFPVWIDYFLHAQKIHQFTFPGQGVGDFSYSGSPVHFYHYNMFIIPAFISALGDFGGIEIATGLLLPFGFLLFIWSMYDYFRYLMRDRSTSLVAALAIFILPHSGILPLFTNGYYDFQWLMFTTPGSAYALAVSILGVYVYQKGRHSKISPALLKAMAFLGTLIFVRAHFMLIVVPALLVLVCLEHIFKSTKREIYFSVCLGLILSVVHAVFFLEWPIFLKTFDFQAASIGHATYGVGSRPMRTLVTTLNPSLFALLANYILLLFSWGYLLFSLLLIQLYKRQLLNSFVGKMWVHSCLITQLLILFAPVASNGDFTEYKHRHFAWLYVLTYVLVVPGVMQGIFSFFSKRLFKPQLLTAIFVFALLVLATYDYGEPKFKSGKQFYRSTQDDSLLEVSYFLKEKSNAADIFVIVGEDVNKRLVDDSTVVSSISGLRAYYSRLGYQWNTEIQEIMDNRYEQMLSLLTYDSYCDVQKVLRSKGVRWYILPVDLKLISDTKNEKADLKNRKWVLYDSYSGCQTP